MGADEGDLLLRAEKDKELRVLPGLRKGDMEEGVSGYSIWGALGTKSLQGILGYLKMLSAERLKGVSLAFLVSTTGCQFTFLNRLEKHCLAGF